MNLPSDPIFSGLVPLVVLWVTVWIQLAIIPFLGKAEKLFVTFKQSGTIDVALSRIDSEGVVKELTSLFEAAIELQEDKRRRADIERLLSKVEYSDVLERLEQATGKTAKISRSYRSLRAKSTRVALWMAPSPTPDRGSCCDALAGAGRRSSSYRSSCVYT